MYIFDSGYHDTLWDSHIRLFHYKHLHSHTLGHNLLENKLTMTHQILHNNINDVYYKGNRIQKLKQYYFLKCNICVCQWLPQYTLWDSGTGAYPGGCSGCLSTPIRELELLAAREATHTATDLQLASKS